MYKTHTNGEIRPAHIGQTVTLAGWVHRVRDHGGVTFIDLRDRFGLVQVVVNPEAQEANQLAEDLRAEWVIQVVGTVRRRPAGNENPHLPYRRGGSRDPRDQGAQPGQNAALPDQQR